MNGCPDPEVLSAYFDREMNSEAHREIERHQRECRTCRKAVERMENLRSDLHQIAPVLEAKERVQRRLTERSVRRPVGVWIPRPVAVLLIFLIGLSLGLNLYHVIGSDRPNIDSEVSEAIRDARGMRAEMVVSERPELVYVFPLEGYRIKQQPAIYSGGVVTEE